MPPTSCPVCQSADTAPLTQISSAEAALHFLADQNSERFAQLTATIEALWGQPSCRLCLCHECGFGFADPYVAGDGKFYELAFERASYPSDKWDFRRAIRAFGDHAIQPGRLLEVGAGFGFFLDMLRGHLTDRPAIVATEFGLPALEALRGKGIDARQQDLRALDAEPFDVLCAFQVVEHLDDLAGLAAAMKRLIVPGGYAMITVPNAALIRFNAENGSLLDMPPNHIGTWSPGALERLGKNAGMVVVELDTEPASLAGFIKTDIAFSYLRRAQLPGSLAHWSRRQRAKPYGKALGMGLALAYAPLRIPVWLKAAKRSDLGGSTFILLRKPPA